MTSLSLPRTNNRRRWRQTLVQAVSGAALLGVVLAGCGERYSDHGQMINEAELASIKVGESTRADIIQSLGRPSFQGAFDADRLYYSSQRMVAPIASPTTTQSRVIYMFTINKNNRLQSIDLIDEKSGINIAHIDDKTPTPGNTFGVIEQIFSNIKRSRAAEPSK